VAEKRTFGVLSVRTIDGRDLASQQSGEEDEGPNHPGPYGWGWGARDEDVQSEEDQRPRDAGRECYGESSQDEVDHGREYRYVLAGDCQNMGNGSIMYGKQAAF